MAIKDHRLAQPLHLVEVDRKRLIRDRAEERGVYLGHVDLEDESTPLNIFIKRNIDNSVHKELIEAFKELRFLHLNYTFVDNFAVTQEVEGGNFSK